MVVTTEEKYTIKHFDHASIMHGSISGSHLPGCDAALVFQYSDPDRGWCGYGSMPGFARLCTWTQIYMMFEIKHVEDLYIRMDSSRDELG